MKKQIKLFLINYDYTVEKFGERQKEFHQSCFSMLLDRWFANRVEVKVPVDGGVLNLIEVQDTDTHTVLKYYYRSYNSHETTPISKG